MSESPMPMYEPPVSPLDDATVRGYTDSEINALRYQVEQEQARRSRLQSMPIQIAAQVKQFVDDGGDQQVVTDAVDNALNPPPVEPEPAPEA